MSSPSELSIEEIRKFMLDNNCKVTNHALVKHFKHFLTHPQTQNEARKQFKIYVNILATIKNESGQKYLILRKKYVTECPPSDVVERAMSADAAGASPNSPGGISIISESSLTSPAPFRQPPPYKPPPEVTPNALNTSATLPVVIAGTTVNQENIENYRDCVNEFEDAVRLIDPTRLERQHSEETENELSEKTAEKEDAEVQLRDKNVLDTADEKMQNQEKIPRFSFSSGNSATSTDGSTAEKVSSSEGDVNENSISVKEAMRKFNRIASEEEAKTNSPVGKKIPEKQQLIESKIVPEVTMAHPKAKEWLVSMAKANYQELAKLANEYPELVKLQDPALTALHWAAKHGNEDVIKLIAGTYKADVNARTNGGYTPLHLAMQFGRVNIFELLCNVYKANRDLTDWSGNKPLDYSKQRTSVSALTYSKIKARRKPTVEKDSGFLRIGSLNVRVKKTTEAFSNFLGVGNGNGNSTLAPATAGKTASLPHYRSHRHHHHQAHGHRHHHAGMMRSHLHPKQTTSAMMNPPFAVNNQANVLSKNDSKFELRYKTWGSADNIIPQNDIATDKEIMPPPNIDNATRKKQQRAIYCSSYASYTTDSPRDSISSSNSSSNLNTGYSSMPSTPHQGRAPISINPNDANQLEDSDSDSACGFNSNWSFNGRNSVSSSNLQAQRYP